MKSVMKIRILVTDTADHIVVINEGDTKQKKLFLSWMIDNHIDSTPYCHTFSDEPNSDDWFRIHDPDHEIRTLIKLRWQ
jgi:hypothetical protein